MQTHRYADSMLVGRLVVQTDRQMSTLRHRWTGRQEDRQRHKMAKERDKVIQTLSFECPTSFSHLWLAQSGYCSWTATLISIYWHSCGHRNFCHGWQPEWKTWWSYQNIQNIHGFFLSKHGTAAWRDDCIQCYCLPTRVKASSCVHN